MIVSGTCYICSPDGQPLADLGAHIRELHPDLLAELRVWPDGEPVIIDRILVPDDFGEDKSGG